MRRIIVLLQSLIAAACLAAMPARAETARLTVELDRPGAPINRGMWGIFFEDINFGADGGLYAELVKNRGFEFPEALMGWFKLSPKGCPGSIALREEKPFHARNPRYLRIESPGGKSPFGIANEGFRGMGVKAGETYHFSAQVRKVTGDVRLRVELYSAGGVCLATTNLEDFSTDWQKRTAVLCPPTTDAKAKLYVLLDGAGTLDLDMISLFPEMTWKGRPGGLRADMVQMLADLKPGFVRFPGGCIVEGIYLANRYPWKTTIGPVEERGILLNRWNVEFLHRPTPDYYQSFGLGFYEYFQLCEDLGAEPLPILSCGLACQFNTGEACPLDQLGPYIQDALDLIEFANGTTDTVWGAKRAALGHPAPFQLKMLGIGNENWQQPYIERYAKFHAALKERHPEIQLVSSAGPGPNDEHFHFAWPKLRELKADIVDEHSYARPDWFYQAASRYDGYDRRGPKVFFGEYAAQSDRTVSVLNRNNLECALAEAACLTGIERNGDVVCMASYAPLFAHVDAWQWKPDLIWVDNLSVYGTPSYYVQKLFANHPGDETVPIKFVTAGAERLFASATRDLRSREVILKVVNGNAAPAIVELEFGGAKQLGPRATVLTLTGGSGLEENSFAQPTKIAPQESHVSVAAAKFRYVFPGNSLTVLRLSLIE